MDKRQQFIQHWLAQYTPLPISNVTLLAGDASFRRYFRLISHSHSYVVMDAPPSHEDCLPFIHVTEFLRKNGLPAPRIFYQNPEEGILVLEDFGDELLRKVINPQNAMALYQTAIMQIIKMQACSLEDSVHIPPFNAEFMNKELGLFRDWFIGRLLKYAPSETEQKILSDFFEILIKNVSAQPQVFIHRDYHSRNLIYINESLLGLIDYQDAMVGPLTYDLVSLLKDAYINWPIDMQQKLVEYFYKHLPNSNAYTSNQVWDWYQHTGVQRHLKVLGIFARLFIRDNKPAYLGDMPRVINYLLETLSQYPDYLPFYNYFSKVLISKFNALDLNPAREGASVL